MKIVKADQKPQRKKIYVEIVDLFLIPGRERIVENGAEGEMMQYLRFDAIMDPGDCQTKPFQNHAANLEGDFCIIKDKHRDWFLLDLNGDPEKLDEMGYLVTDPGHAE